MNKDVCEIASGGHSTSRKKYLNENSIIQHSGGRHLSLLARDHRFSILGKSRDAKRRSSGRIFFYPTLTLVIDSYSIAENLCLSLFSATSGGMKSDWFKPSTSAVFSDRASELLKRYPLVLWHQMCSPIGTWDILFMVHPFI